MIRAKPYPHQRGAAWLSSARVVKRVAFARLTGTTLPGCCHEAFHSPLCGWNLFSTLPDGSLPFLTEESESNSEGRSQVVMALICGATHVLQRKDQWVPTEQSRGNPEALPQYRLEAAIRPP